MLDRYTIDSEESFKDFLEFLQEDKPDKTIKNNLATSEAWKFNIPKVNHLALPLTVWPIPGTNTNTNGHKASNKASL